MSAQNEKQLFELTLNVGRLVGLVESLPASVSAIVSKEMDEHVERHHKKDSKPPATMSIWQAMTVKQKAGILVSIFSIAGVIAAYFGIKGF